MNFSALSNQRRFGKILRFPLKFIPAEMHVPILQGKLKGKRWIVGSFYHGCWLGSYEYQKRLLFEKTVREGSTVFDLGAHVGFYTLLSSVVVGPHGRVVAFEPLPENLYYLRQHLELNRVPNVTVIEAAVADRCGTAFFEAGPNPRRTRAHIATGGTLQIKTVGLDELLSTGELPMPDYIKVDIQGAELQFLTGAESMLAQRQPTIFLATHGFEIHRQCYLFLNSLGYTVRPISRNRMGPCRELLAYVPGTSSSGRAL